MKNKVLYVGVSPKPLYGCNYWYVDETGLTKPKTFVWVRMGRHDREQLAFVDSVLWCEVGNAPYSYEKAKRIIRQATEEETERAKIDWQTLI